VGVFAQLTMITGRKLLRNVITFHGKQWNMRKWILCPFAVYTHTHTHREREIERETARICYPTKVE